ncbi:hypothetical protein FXO38_10119 [Capsicum annuum]|nr:hypothetical protein FXO38_10119 [Capsicum annuum]
MDEHIVKTPTNSGIRNMNLVFDAPSFSFGLTQEDLVKVVSNPLQLKKSGRSKEIRLKFRNDEVKMTEILQKKKRVEENSFSKGAKNLKKGHETKRKSKEIEDDVDKSYADESKEESQDEKKQCVAQTQLCRCVMMLEVKGSSSSGILICANGTSLSFTLKKFAIITGLNCVAKRNYTGKAIISTIHGESMGDNNDEDSEKFTILYFLHSFVLSNVETVVIPRLHFDLVDSGRFKDFSWDSLSFEDLARSLNNRLKASGKFYLIKEMPLAIQVWLYECCSNVPPKIASKVDNRIPRLLNWKMIAPRPHFEFLMNAMFKDNGKVRQEIKGIHQLVKKKFKKMLKAIEQSKQQHEDTGLEAQQMDYAGVEILPQQFSSAVDQNLGENQETTKGYTDLHPDKTNIEIDSQHLIPDELLQSINLDYNLSGKIVHHDIRRESITTDSTVTREEEPSDEHFNDKKFESIVQDHCQKHPFIYHPIDGIVDTKIVNKFMDWISEDLLKVHAKRKANADHYKRGKSTMPMMHFAVETVKDKNWFYTMGFPDQSWIDSQIDVCFYYLRKKSKYDPNRSYTFSTVDCNFMNIIRFIHDVYFLDDTNLTERGQAAHLNEYIRGFRMHAAMPWHTVEDIYIPVECLSYGHKVLANEFNFNALCKRYAAFLWDYGTRKQDANAHSDVKEPLRPARQSRITSVTEVFDV